MESERSLPHSQSPANCPYHERKATTKSEALWNVPQHPNFWLKEVVSSSPNPHTWWPSLFRCPRLLIQYIRSYPLYLEPVPPPAAWRRAMLWWQGGTYHGLVCHDSFSIATDPFKDRNTFCLHDKAVQEDWPLRNTWCANPVVRTYYNIGFISDRNTRLEKPLID